MTSLAAVSPEVPQRKAALPDIFLVTIDTLRADHVHCYGYARVETPALDGLAGDGVRFTQAFTPSPITNTSHTTILTGLLPSRHGVTDFAVPLAAAHATWAELLHKQGYHTAAFIGAVILDSKTLAPGLDRGFDYYDNFPEHSPTKSRWGRVERRGMEVVQHAEAWLTAHPAGPHFVWVHLYDPHDPYEPPAPYSQTYHDHLYDGEIAYADSALANFIAYLKTHNAYQNSLIVAVGDHGEGLGEHHEDTHGIFLYDSTTHVPLIAKLPGRVSAGKVVDAQVRTTDILPTALDFTGGAVPEKLDGESLRPYLKATDSTSRVAVGETDYPLRFGWAALRSVRTDGLKLIEAPRPELYDLKNDPGELENKYEAQDARVQKLRGTLAEMLPPFPASVLPDPKDRVEEQNFLHTAMIASEDNRPEDARASLEKTLQLNPKSPTALRQLGELELQAGDYVRAAQHLKGAVKERPDDATAAFYEGQALEKSHDLAGARDALESSLKLMPGQFPARLLLGQVYLGLKDAKAAEDQFEAALLLQSNSLDAQLGLAKAQLIEGNFADAVRQLDPLSKAHPANAEVFDLLAQAYAGSGKAVEARQAQIKADQLRKVPR
jgi:arylsulfatase A-like enzyme/Flp pilus assembly protein TadD